MDLPTRLGAGQGASPSGKVPEAEGKPATRAWEGLPHSLGEGPRESAMSAPKAAAAWTHFLSCSHVDESKGCEQSLDVGPRKGEATPRSCKTFASL